MRDIKQMTLKEKLGQLIIAGFDSYEYNKHAKTLIEEYKVSNFILFTRNIHDIEQLSKLNHKLYDEVMKNTNTIPFIAIDQEGGMVTRIMSGATFCPGNMTLASSNDPNNSYLIGKIQAEELCRLGINMNFAPSLDVNNNPDNPVIGVRSYADNPETVYLYGKNYIKGLQENKIIATAKHFPGHGDVNVDSHVGLPVVNKTKDEINKTELYPFKKVINDVDAIMSAHIIFTAYDNLFPATLSKTILTDLLKSKLGFKGLIISDCMQMQAIAKKYTTEKGVVMGIKAGLDMVCICHTLDKQVKSLEMLEEAVKNGEIEESEIDEKVKKVLEYKEKVKDNLTINFINNKNNLDYFYHNDKNKELSYNIVQNSLTLVKGKHIEINGKTLVISSRPKALTVAEDELDNCDILEEIIKQNLPVDIYEYKINNYDFNLVNVCSKYDTVIFCSFNCHDDIKQADMINDINKVVSNFYVIAMRNPYDILKLDVKNFLTFYECTPNSIKACIKYLLGEFKPIGVLPIKLDSKTLK